MRTAFAAVAALTIGLVGVAQARHTETGLRKEGTPVVIVGQVTSAPKKVLGAEQKHFQIALGPKKADTYTLHVSDADIIGISGKKLATSDLDDKQWVRAEGTIMNDPHRIKVEKLEVIARDSVSVKKNKYYRSGMEHGYIEDLRPEKAP